MVQQCIVHLIRNSFRYAGRQHRDGIGKALRPGYTAPSEQAAKDRFEEFAAEWGGRYPAIVQLWRNSWAEFVPFLEYDVEIRRVICTTNAIESINARYRRAVRARGHFPNEQAALKCLYLVTRSLNPTGGGRAPRPFRRTDSRPQPHQCRPMTLRQEQPYSPTPRRRQMIESRYRMAPYMRTDIGLHLVPCRSTCSSRMPPAAAGNDHESRPMPISSSAFTPRPTGAVLSDRSRGTVR